MAWKVSCAMDERVQFIGKYLEGQSSMSSLCEEFGISRKTGYKWVSRYQAEGGSGLEERSRAPRHHPHAVSKSVVEAVLARRKTIPQEGPLKIRAHLREQHPELSCPAASTIAEILREHGLVRKRRRRNLAVPPSDVSPLSGYTQPNDAWCADFKGWFRTGNGDICTPLTVSDTASRFLLVCHSMSEGYGFESIRPVFEGAFREYGLPQVIRTDNGPPFGSRGLGGLSPFCVWLIQLAITPEHIRPGKPQDNGRHERMHRTLKECSATPPRGSVRAQQRAFEQFKQYYNYERPHQALGQRPPADLYSPSPRPFPKSLLEPAYPREWSIRKVKHKGGILWQSKEHYLGQSLAGHHVGLKPIDNDCWLIHFFDIPLAILDEPGLVLRPWRTGGPQ